MTGKTLILMAMMAFAATAFAAAGTTGGGGDGADADAENAVSSTCGFCGEECPSDCWDAFRSIADAEPNPCSAIPGSTGWWAYPNTIPTCQTAINAITNTNGGKELYRNALLEMMKDYVRQKCADSTVTPVSPHNGGWLQYGVSRVGSYCTKEKCGPRELADFGANSDYCPNIRCSDYKARVYCRRAAPTCTWTPAQSTCVSDGGSMTDTYCAGQKASWKCGHSNHGYADCKWHRELAHCADATQPSQTNLVQQGSDKKKTPVDDLISLLDDASRAGVQDFTCW